MEKQKTIETENLKKYIKKLGIDVHGIADMQLLTEMETSLPTDVKSFVNMFLYAILLGAQCGKLGKKSFWKRHLINFRRYYLFYNELFRR